jgi:hypothetical protein
VKSVLDGTPFWGKFQGTLQHRRPGKTPFSSELLNLPKIDQFCSAFMTEIIKTNNFLIGFDIAKSVLDM